MNSLKLAIAFFCFAPAALSLAGVVNMGPAEFAEKSKSDDVIILDVRTPQEIAQGKIENASELNFYDDGFSEKVKRLQKDKTILVYCRSGARSGQAAILLDSFGYENVVNLEGGIGAWKKEALPLVQSEFVDSGTAESLSLSEVENAIAQEHFVLLDFHTQWCLPCKRMYPVINDFALSHSDTVTVLKIDADANAALVEKFAAETVPTFILFENGNEKWRHTGIVSLERLQSLVK